MKMNIRGRVVPLAVTFLWFFADAAWGQIAFQSSASNMTSPNSGNAANTLTITKPTGTLAGDFLLAQITFEKGADAGTNAQITPAGWTFVRRTNVINATTGTDLGQAIFYKVAGAGEPASYNFPFFQAVKAAGGILRYTGVNVLHPSGPIVAHNGGPGESNPLTAPTVNALQNSVVVSMFGVKKTTTLSIPAGTTSRFFQQNPQDVSIRAVDEPRGADGATGSRTSTAGSVDKWAAQQVAIRGNTVPVYTAPAAQNSTEGNSFAFGLGGFADADAHPSWSITVNWGDGNPSESFNVFAAGSIGTRNHAYVDNGDYTVTVTVNDGTNGHSGSFTASVGNAAPVVTAATAQNSNEAEDKSFSLGSFTDAGVNDGPWGVEVNWGDGSSNTTFQVAAQGSLGSQNHAYVDNGSYTVTVTVTDKDSGSGQATFEASVSNLAPTVTAAADQGSNSGVEASFNLGSFSDAGANDNPWSVDVDWGDGTNDNFNSVVQGSLGSLNHTYADLGLYTVSIKVTDKDGDYGEGAFDVSVSNVAPVVTPAANQESDEGQNQAFALGSFSDSGVSDGPWSVDVDWGDGNTDNFVANAQGTLGTLNHTHADNGTYAVVVKVTDKNADSSQSGFDVTVSNVAPVVVPPANQASFAGVETAFDLGTFSDAGVNDTPWDVEINWGDGSSNTLVQLGSQGSLGVQNHTFAGTGGYTVSITATDKDGGVSDAATFEVSVTPSTHSISGTIKDGSNTPVQGVTVTASDGYDALTATDAAGFYQFPGIPGGTDLTITPTKAGHTFGPPFRTYANVSNSETNQDFLASTQPTYATVEVDAVSTATCHCVSTAVSHTVSGDNRLLVVGISLEKGDAARRITGVRYSGIDLTRLAEVVSASGEPRADVWYLTNPPLGTADVSVSLDEKNKILVGAVSYTGVDQSNPIGGVVTGSSAAGSPNLTIPSSSGAVAMDVVAFLRPTMSPNAGQVPLWNAGMHDSGKKGGASTKPGGSPSANVGWTSDVKADKWAGVGFSINPGSVSKGSGLGDLSASLEVAPREFVLDANYPNPFNPSTEIRFSVENSGHATLHVFNVSGQLVATLFDDVAQSERYYRVQFDASRLASGIYFYRLQSEARSDVKKMLLLK